MIAAMWFDVALTINPVTGRFDVSIANGDLAIDRTPATPLIMSVLTDRRAQAGDVLPVSETTTGPIFNARRGWAGDALDRNGQFIGSRFWLLLRAKQTEDTRLTAISYGTQATAWIGLKAGAAVAVSASWLRRGVLGVVFQVGNTTVNLPVATT
jgi:phage gp46-like protein